MYYKGPDLKKLFEQERKAMQKTFKDKRLDAAVELLSDALFELKKIGVETELAMKHGGSDLAFSMAGSGTTTCYMHGTISVGNQKYLLGIFTQVNGEDCLQLRISRFDIDGNNPNSSVSATAFDLTQGDGLKGFQGILLRAAALQEVVREHDTHKSLSMKDLSHKRFVAKRKLPQQKKKK